jgi:Trypsin
VLGVCSSCIACSAPPSDGAKHTSIPGYPDTTSRLSLNLQDNMQKHCHATLVHPQWALTAAHCFSLADADAWGALGDFERGFLGRDVEFYPGAHASGATRRDAVWHDAEFSAAHDLALVPIDPPFDDVVPVSSWAPRLGCSLSDGLGVRAELGRRTRADRAETADLTLLGMVDAAELLGPDHGGLLLSAEGANVGPGDSGSGATAAWSDLAALAQGCELEPSTPSDPGERLIVGVVQDANLENPNRPFGLVPLHNLEHAAWLAAQLAATVRPPPREPPMLLPEPASPLPD